MRRKNIHRWICGICGITVRSDCRPKHLRSQRHLRNCEWIHRMRKTDANFLPNFQNVGQEANAAETEANLERYARQYIQSQSPSLSTLPHFNTPMHGASPSFMGTPSPSPSPLTPYSYPYPCYPGYPMLQAPGSFPPLGPSLVPQLENPMLPTVPIPLAARVAEADVAALERNEEKAKDEKPLKGAPPEDSPKSPTLAPQILTRFKNTIIELLNPTHDDDDIW
eukprot:gnl/Trimastix_PCT/3016.p1 GENE.gnl/Trimastix_PCT/3016~~gnl/Trimastix_PCT/3016.p1  ORF type:complete len:223 (-),score=27.09 gnl/Trimastix_PCT/3016:29-697(-)